MEAHLLMLGSHNILNPANGSPITVPSQDMVLGLYYITKERPGAKGSGLKFYGPEEVIIAYDGQKIDMHAPIEVRLPVDKQDASKGTHMVKTTAGRIIVNQYVPDEVPYVNELLGKKALRSVITTVIKSTGVTRTAQFLDDIKNLGYYQAFRAGISFNLGDVLVPAEKYGLIEKGYKDVEGIKMNYAMGFITNNERYNKVIDLWTVIDNKLTGIVREQISADQQGFNPVFMMLDSGARGSVQQIKQLCGMRGLMAKPQKSGAAGAEIIENPIVSNLKEGMTVLEYFISTHGARKGLADTALKTADAGYLTRRLVDVSHDVIITEEDCGTLRGLIATAIKNKDEVVESLGERILGRTSVHDIHNPLTGELIIAAGEEIREDTAALIDSLPIEQVEIRSVLTCESRKGVCAKCYGRNLATSRMVEKGEVVGVIAAQSIGEPGTQLTLRTFHVGGTASGSPPYLPRRWYGFRFRGGQHHRIQVRGQARVHGTPHGRGRGRTGRPEDHRREPDDRTPHRGREHRHDLLAVRHPVRLHAVLQGWRHRPQGRPDLRMGCLQRHHDRGKRRYHPLREHGRRRHLPRGERRRILQQHRQGHHRRP